MVRDLLAAMQPKSRWSEMKQAQVDEMASTAARLERDLQPGRWDDGVSDEEASCSAEVQRVVALRRTVCRQLVGPRTPANHACVSFLVGISLVGLLWLEMPLPLDSVPFGGFTGTGGAARSPTVWRVLRSWRMTLSTRLFCSSTHVYANLCVLSFRCLVAKRWTRWPES